MPTSNNDMHKWLLVWPKPIVESVAMLFTMVFVRVSELIEYICEEVTETDTFHLIIHLDCLDMLFKSVIHQFPQVRRIDVYFDGIDELEQISHGLELQCQKLQFSSIYDLVQRLETIQIDGALASSDPLYRNTITPILSSIADRLRNKRSLMLAHHSQILPQLTSVTIYGLLVKDIARINPQFICPSCELIFHQTHQLECGHRTCAVCLNIRRRCMTCLTVVSKEKARFDRQFETLMARGIMLCFACSWQGTLQTYQEHVRANHLLLLTHVVRNLKVDADNADRFNVTERHQYTSLTHRFRLYADQSITSMNGTCIWQVSDILTMRDTAADDQSRSILSSPVYLYPNGYRICLRLFPNGDAKARGAYMSLFFVLMRGNHDDDLQWPFEWPITLTLLDHLPSNEHHSHTFRPNITSVEFQQPRGNMNPAYGVSKFLSLDLFKTHQHRYVRNGKMFIRAEVNFSDKRPILLSATDSGGPVYEHERVDAEVFSHLLCVPETV